MRRGVTLIELLIAVSLVSLLSLGMLFAIRVGLNAMQKANAKLIANRRVFGVERVIEQQIAGLMPVTAECQPNGGAPQAKITFFQGEPQSMRFVSSYSLNEAARGYPRILEFQVIPTENNTGVRLIVNERLYSGPQSAGANCTGMGRDSEQNTSFPLFLPIQIGPGSFVLADRLAYCRILYRETMPAPVLERWVQRWTKPMLPSAIRFEMAPQETDASRIQLTSITAPVRITRDPLGPYVD